MRILISAIACHPSGGSEGYVGWSAINALAKEHHLTVLTHVSFKEASLAAMAAHPLRERISFHFIGKPHRWHPNRMVARLQSWLDYRHWCVEARKTARHLVSESHFDLGHHVTYATWRMGSPLAGLGIPWVFGPIGGGEVFPKEFLDILSPTARVFEHVRALSGWIASRSPRIRRELATAAVVLPNNHETRDAILRMGVSPGRVQILSQSFLNEEKLHAFQASNKQPPGGGALRIFAGGNLEGRKGVAIVLHALVKLQKRGIPFRFIYGGQGPEYLSLCALAKTLQLNDDRVSLGKIFSFDEYRQQLKESHVYLLPSLREGAPLTMLEAMQAGCVPVVAKCGGAAMTVTDECGFALAPTNPEELACRIAEVLERLWRSQELLQRLSHAAVERVKTYASEEAYLAGICEAYAEALHFRLHSQ